MADEQARGQVSSSSRMLEEAFETGTAILSSMAGQRERLKVDPDGMPDAAPLSFHCIGMHDRLNKACLKGLVVVLTMLWQLPSRLFILFADIM